MVTTIENLKSALGKGAGTRKNKYMLEIPIPGTDSSTLNVLCKNASLPERNIAVASAFHRGRKYNMRAETDFGGSYQITIIDDSNMTFRKIFDKWSQNVDNSTPGEKTSFIGAEGVYQIDINIWQLGNNSEKIYGYKIENAFPSIVGSIDFDDSELDTLNEFQVTLTFSEFSPLESTSVQSTTPTSTGDMENVEELFT